ncbi:MAG: TQO small subunit DoxD [Acidimicrobiales bacterium]
MIKRAPVGADSPTSSPWPMVAVRLLLGVMWLQNAGWKRPPDFGANDRSGLFFFTSTAVDHPVWGPYTWVVENLILPNFTPFGWTVLLTEAALGAFLLLGLGTRFWALVGLAMSVTITLSVMRLPAEWPYALWLLIAAHLAVLATAPGRHAGLDGLLRPMWARSSSSLAARALRWT